MSSTTDATREGVDCDKGSSLVKTDSGREILFLPWTPSSCSQDPEKYSKFSKKIQKFVSGALQIVSNTIKDEKLVTIMFLTTDWEKCSTKKELALEMINQVQQQLEIRSGCQWRILFTFSKDPQQTELHQQFSSVIQTKQNENDSYLEVLLPITSM